MLNKFYYYVSEWVSACVWDLSDRVVVFFVMWGVNGDIVPPRCHVLWNMLAAFVSLWLVLLFWQFHTMVPSCTMMLSSPSQYDCWNSGLHGSILTWDTWIAQPWDTANAHSKEDARSHISGDFFFSTFLFWIAYVNIMCTPRAEGLRPRWKSGNQNWI